MGVPAMNFFTLSDRALPHGKSGICAVVVLCAIAGCSSPSVDQMLPPVQRASAGSVSPDGNYDGQLIANGSVGPESGECGGTDSFALAIRDSKFRLVLSQPQVPYRRKLTFDVTVAPDGTFNTEASGTYIRGKVSQGHLAAQATGDACLYDVQADRNGTW
jgi:hypothetical protein